MSFNKRRRLTNGKNQPICHLPQTETYKFFNTKNLFFEIRKLLPNYEMAIIIVFAEVMIKALVMDEDSCFNLNLFRLPDDEVPLYVSSLLKK